MSDATAEVQSEAINPMDDLEGWTAQRAKQLVSESAAAETEAQPPEPATEPAPVQVEPAVAPEEPKKDSWRNMPLDDVDDGFLKGKPASQLYDSYKASVAAMQKAQREANESKSELARIRQEAETRTAPAATQALPNPEADPEIDEINRLLFDDTPAALKLIEKRTEERSRAVAREEYQRSSQAEASENWKQSATQASITATQRVAQLYGWDEQEALVRMKSTFPVIADFVPQWGPQLWTNPDVYVGAIERLYGKPPQAQAEATAAPEPVAATPVPTPVVPNPPGSGRPAPVAATPTKASSTMSREMQDARRSIAEQVQQRTGIPVADDDFVRGKRKGSNA